MKAMRLKKIRIFPLRITDFRRSRLGPAARSSGFQERPGPQGEVIHIFSPFPASNIVLWRIRHRVRG
jgi:hypothetical protein